VQQGFRTLIVSGRAGGAGDRWFDFWGCLLDFRGLRIVGGGEKGFTKGGCRESTRW